MTIAKQIKAMATKAGVKTKVRTQGNVYVTFLSEPSNELVDRIKALSTQEAHGDLMNDTRWYSGQAVHVSYQYAISAAAMAQFETIKNRYSDTGYHFQQAVKNEMGYRGQAILDQVRF